MTITPEKEVEAVVEKPEVVAKEQVSEWTEKIEKATTGDVYVQKPTIPADISQGIAGQNQVTAPAVSITVPSDPQQLMTQAKGSPTNALTWLSVFWLRMIKKALHFGWKIVGRSPNPGENSLQSTDYGLQNNKK